MKRLTQGATRLLVLVLGLGLTATGWAATLSSSGYISKDSANPTAVFSGVAITDIALGKYVLSGNIGGGNVDTDGEAGAYNYSVVAVDNVNSISSLTVQFQRIDGGYCKCVEVVFTESSPNVIKAYANRAGYKSGAALGGSSFDWNGTVVTDATSKGYGVYDLSLTLADQKPLAVWDGAKGDFKKTTVNNVTFGANGNTVPDDGSYVKITGSKGALFDLGAAYSYVVAEFTVTNLNETASADRVLALWSPSGYDGITVGTTTTLGVYLESGAKTTHGIWQSKTWSSSSSSIKSGVSQDSKRTFALTVEDSTVLLANDSKIGTHLFELTGDNPNTAIFGGSGNIGLRANQTYRLLSVGGLAKGTELSAFTDLVVTKVVIYASNHRQFTSGSSGIVDVASVENPTTVTVANGETISASTLNTETPVCVYTEAGATLNLDASLASSVYFFGSIAGDNTGLTLSANGTVKTTAVANLPFIKGSGTVELTNVYGTPLDLRDKGASASDWRGTMVFKDISSKSGWEFSKIGNANSKVRFDGVTDAYFNSTESFDGTVDIASGGLKLHYANSQRLTTIATLTGSGNFTIDGGSSSGAGVVFQNASGYTGKVTLGSGCNQQVTFGSSGSYGTSAKIIIASDASVTPGATWEAAGGIEVNGTLTLNSTIGMPAVAGGAGTIICNQKVPNNDGLLNSTWKGTLKINGDVGDNANTKIGNSASTLEIATGSVTLTDVTILPGRTVIDSGATLNIANTGVTEFTLGAVENSGTLDLSGCTSLTTLNFVLGTNRTVNLGSIGMTFKVPASLSAMNASVTEAAGEGGTTVINSAQLPVLSCTYSLTHINGTAIAEFQKEESMAGGTVTLTYVPQIDGAATALDATFTNTLNLAYSKWSGVTSMQHDGIYENPQLPVQYNNNLNDKSTGVYLKYHPYVNSISGKIKTIQDRMTMAVVGTMSPTANRMFIHMGLSTGSSKGLLLTRTANENEVLVAYNKGTTITPITMMTVPNCSTARHVYIITKEDGASSTTFTVYLDGIKWKTVTTESVIAFSDNNANVQVGSDAGGAIKGDSSATYKPVNIQASVEDEPGVINLMRLYDRIITPAEIAAYKAEYPYVSPNGSSSRTFTAASEYWIDETPGSEVWENSSGEDSGSPIASASLNVTADVATEVTVNLASDTSYEALVVNGAKTAFVNGANNKMLNINGVTTIGAETVIECGAVNIAGAPVIITEDGSVEFDYSCFDVTTLSAVPSVIELTGPTDRNDSKVTLVAPSETQSTFVLAWDEVSTQYKLTITPAATVTKNDTTVAYPTVAAAITALGTDAGTLTLYSDSTADITLSVGQVLDTGTTTYTGTPSPTGEYIELVHSGTTWKAVDNSVNTWKSSVTTGEWNVATNWVNGVKPKSYTRVIFPENVDGYTVYLRLCGESTETQNDKAPVCAGMVVDAQVDMVHDPSDSANWGYIFIYGDVSGKDTLALHKVGLYSRRGSSVTNTVSCNLSVVIHSNTGDDSTVRGGPFVFDGAVTVTTNSELRVLDCAAVFNELVTIENGAKANGKDTGTALFNGGISVPADAAATLEGSGRVTIASTVTLAAGATLTVPNATTVSDATFATPVADSYVKATAGESTTVYSVAAKRTATMSVGTNAALSINGNAVADGDTVKFVPGDVLTITASADTYYTPALTVNGVAQTSPYELTTTDADVTVSATATRDTVAITIPSVDNTTVSVSYTSGGAAQEATAEGDITVDAGTSLTATWTAASGYKITAGASQTINPVVSAQTLDSPTVEAMGATVSDVNFSYGADYATATVTATVAGDATSATLTYGGTTYNAQVSNGTATFTDVAVSRDANNIYTPVTYEITTDAHATTGGSGSAVAAETTSWFSHNSSGLSGGAWSNTVDLTEGPATVEDNTFTATAESTSSRVVLEFNVCFSAINTDNLDGEAQAAIKLGEVDSATTFMVLASNAAWTPVSRGDFVPDASATYKVVMTIDYGNGSYGVTVGDNVLTNASGSASFPLAASGATSVKNIDFAGSGTLTSMKGDQVEGYMVKDNAGHWYATIQAATQAYNSANGPYTVLHDGTAPSGWQIVNGVLKKVIKGFLFMAY